MRRVAFSVLVVVSALAASIGPARAITGGELDGNRHPNVAMIKMTSGMDQSYLQYLDGQFKKSEEAQIKAGFEKSYKILRTMDDGGAWNLLILREYTSLANIETNQEKADALLQQTDGNDQAQMQGYQDRSKYREVVGTKYARELLLK